MLEINVEELKDKIEKKEDFILLDVRRDEEYNYTHIAQSIHIPLHELMANYNKIKKDKEIIVYCHHGVRSLKATHILLELGFTKVKSLAGGIHSWSNKIDSSIPTY